MNQTLTKTRPRTEQTLREDDETVKKMGESPTGDILDQEKIQEDIQDPLISGAVQDAILEVEDSEDPDSTTQMLDTFSSEQEGETEVTEDDQLGAKKVLDSYKKLKDKKEDEDVTVE